MYHSATRVAFAGAALATLALATPAYADRSIIREKTGSTYNLEVEPHGLVGLHDSNPVYGAGARVGFPIVKHGFIPSINNSIAIGVGGDWTPDVLWVPGVMQWNFYLSENWSVFGEPGAVLRLDDHGDNSLVDFTIAGGGRFHFSDDATLTIRLGYPSATVGVSFFL